MSFIGLFIATAVLLGTIRIFLITIIVGISILRMLILVRLLPSRIDFNLNS